MKTQIAANQKTWVLLPAYTDRNVFPIGYARGDGATAIFAEVNSDGGTPDQCCQSAKLVTAAPQLRAALADLSSNAGEAVALTAAGLVVPVKVWNAIVLSLTRAHNLLNGKGGE